MNDNEYMQMALTLAGKGCGRVSPNPMVGAVVVNDDRVVGKGYHQYVGGPHAEVNAIDDAGDAARNATLYVTLEPCNHFGRTPPCTQKILEAGIKRVVVAMQDPNPDVAGGGNTFLVSRGVDLVCGVEEAAARRLNESFIKFVRTGKPFVILKIASTLDGRIATRTGDARWVTGASARAHVHQLRHAMDAIMVGVGTVEADDPELTTRLENGRGVDPIRVVLDTSLRMPEKARMLHQTSTAPTWVVCGPDAPPAAKERLRAEGAMIVQTPLKGQRIDLDVLMQQLAERGVTSLLIEGGGQVAGAALRAGVVDKVVFFYAPKIYGGDDGVPICGGPGPDLMRESLAVSQIELDRMGDDIMVSGYLRPNAA
jgi:diaminohydroxyphosphoribosylaminopyrimidine deaminase/5-amino-6-(5-phosphoribosylamino)uracil reductase